MWSAFAVRMRCAMRPAACAAVAGTALVSMRATAALAEPAAPEAPPLARNGRPLTTSFIADAAAVAAPSLVNISVALPFGIATSSCSGFIIDEGGLIVTNAHGLLQQANKRCTVTLHDGATRLPGSVLALDAASDIALVKVGHDKPLPVAKLGTSDEVRPGEFVVALGAPLGLSNSVSMGVVSAVERTSSELGLRGPYGGHTASAYIQTDAAINQGNSGGPLVNCLGEVIGVNCMRAAGGVDGIAFAIPIDEVKRVVAQLQAHGRVRRPYLGVRFVELRDGVADHLSDLLRRKNKGEHTFPSKGLSVVDVEPGSPARQAGLLVGDTILSVDGHPVHTTRSLVSQLADKIGEIVEIEVQRDEAHSKIKCRVDAHGE